MTDIPTSSFQAQDEPCTHPKQELRRRVVSNGVAHFVLQCQHCGGQIRAVGKDDPLRKSLTGLPPDSDETIAGQYWQDKFDRFETRRQAYDAQREREAAAWREHYDEYIGSQAWRDKADLRLTRDRYECQARLSGCQGRATQVHHLTYRHFENEPLFELVSVCRRCHEQLHPDEQSSGGAVSHAAD